MYKMLIFDWGKNKNRRNIATHGIDFVQANKICGEAVLKTPSPQLNHGEERCIAVSVIGPEEWIK